jgi:hypothetical protein
MNPPLPDGPSSDDPWVSADEIGEFRQGNPLSQWALSRYLVGRAVGEAVSRNLLVLALLPIALAALSHWLVHSTLLTVLFVVLALGVLVLRWALRSVLRRLTATAQDTPIEARLRALVSDTRGDVLRELRRVGLPSRTITLPLLASRLVGAKRAETLARLRFFDIDRAVPKARLDELHLLLRDARG